MIDLSLIRIFLLVWGILALTIRLIYANRARTRKAEPGVPQTVPHPLAVLAMATWFGLFGAIVVAPAFVQTQLFALPGQDFARIVGMTGLTLGLLLLLKSHQALGEFYGVKLYIKQAHQVIDFGPYTHVRHPMYTTYFVWFASLVLIIPHALPLFVFLIGIYGFRRMAAGEEHMLGTALGQPYERYMEKTGRFLPKL